MLYYIYWAKAYIDLGTPRVMIPWFPLICFFLIITAVGKLTHNIITNDPVVVQLYIVEATTIVLSSFK